MRRRFASFPALFAVCLLALASCASDEEGDAGAGPERGDSPAADAQAGAGGDTTATERAQGEPGDEADTPADEPEASTDEPEAPAGDPAPQRPRTAPIRATLTAFFDGLGAKDAQEVCRTFARRLRDLVGSAVGSDCVGGMTAAFALFVPAGLEDEFAEIEVRRVSVDGKEATAELRLPAKLRALPALALVAREGKVSLERENGSWLLVPSAL